MSLYEEPYCDVPSCNGIHEWRDSVEYHTVATSLPMYPRTSQNLFQLGPFTLPSGETTHFKIECDALTEDDWKALARLAVELLPPFGRVEGVPRGGIPFADALQQYTTPNDETLLIADDVWVTGISWKRHCNYRDAIGVVAFTRNFANMPAYVVPLIMLDRDAEAATYRLDREI